MRTLTRTSSLLSLVALTSVFGCAHAPSPKGQLAARFQPSTLLEDACAPGANIREVKGVAWMKAKSREASGQFPAVIDAVAPNRLKLEVTQPFGGTYAILTVQGSSYRIDVPGKPERNQQGRESWGGIPLKWATDLFLGRIPCPDADEVSRSSVTITPENELVVEVRSPARQKFVYGFDEKHGKEWPVSLHWESRDASVDFEFDDPDENTLSPGRWGARSKQGEVKIRWRDREIVR